MSKDLICPKCNTEYWGLATGKNGAKCSNCSYEFAVADVKAVLLPNLYNKGAYLAAILDL